MCADLCGREGVGVETPCRGGGRAPCPPPGRARPLLYLTLAGLGEAPRAGSWSHGAARRLRPRSRRPWARAAAGRGLRGSGVSAVPARGSGADKARCRPGRQHRGSGRWARPPLAGEDAGCRRCGQWKRGKTGWCHGNSQWRSGAGPGGRRQAWAFATVQGLRVRWVKRPHPVPEDKDPVSPTSFRGEMPLRTSCGWICRICVKTSSLGCYIRILWGRVGCGKLPRSGQGQRPGQPPPLGSRLALCRWVRVGQGSGSGLDALPPSESWLVEEGEALRSGRQTGEPLGSCISLLSPCLSGRASAPPWASAVTLCTPTPLNPSQSLSLPIIVP